MSITPSDTQTPEFYGYEKCPICGEYTKTVGGHWHRDCPQCGGARYDADNDVCADCEAAFEAWVSEEMDNR